MVENRRQLLAAIPMLVFASALVSQSQESSTARQGVFRESESESLWQGRYAHCDFGFYVLLPKGIVAHVGPPINPTSGFLVGLPDAATERPVSIEDRRVVYVFPEHNSLGFHSLDEVVDYEINLKGKKKHGFSVVERRPVNFNGLAGTELKLEYDTPKGRLVELEVVLFRAGPEFIYHIGLRTTTTNYEFDEAVFQQVKAGFRFWKIHSC